MKTNISKKLSFLLRHSKEPLYVDLNGGWADVNTILYGDDEKGKKIWELSHKGITIEEMKKFLRENINE